MILTNYVKDGIFTLNEARDVLGLDPVEGGDMPMFATAQGCYTILSRQRRRPVQRPLGNSHGCLSG